MTTFSEDNLTSRCYLWFHNSYRDERGRLFHVPNGGKRDAPTANRLMAMGVVAGIPDFLFITRHSTFIGIELKVGKNPLSPEQVKLHLAWSKIGVKVYVVRDDIEEFKKIILEWI
jgi:hypothetical protein